MSSPNCRPCEQFKKQTLADPRVKALLSDETMTEIPTKDWRRWWKPGMRTPFIVFVRPPNSIVGRMHCPLAPEEFIRAFTKHKIGKTDEKKSN